MLNDYFKLFFIEDDSLNPEMGTIYRSTNRSCRFKYHSGRRFWFVGWPGWRKSCGPDLLSCKVLKLFAAIIALCLTTIFNYSLLIGTLPNIWKVATVNPIFKKGSKKLPTNYRPISLTSVVYKLLEHIISSKIHCQVENHNILSDNQHGFRSERSCESQLVYITQSIN